MVCTLLGVRDGYCLCTWVCHMDHLDTPCMDRV